MARYLTNEQLRTVLSLGRSIEQWLLAENIDDYVVIKWLRIDQEKDLRYIVSYVECFDDGDAEYNDIYSFSPINPDEPYYITSFDSASEALSFVINNYGASEGNFVSAGVIQDEYLDYYAQKNS